jgi:hypothetical protein
VKRIQVMTETVLGRLVLTVCLCAGASGCATRRGAGANEAPRDPLHVPLALRGANTVVRIEFPSGRQTITPGQFQKDEVCYLTAAQFRIDCYTDGSSLNLGPMDSNELLTDNPGWNLQPAEEDEPGRQMLQIGAVLALVAGSVDRLPSTLADYIQAPGPHMNEALDLVEALLTEDKVRLAGYARGGNFNVTVELSDAGRVKLESALDEMGESAAGVQQVRALRRGRTKTRLRVVR